jgi:hypothetical protein
MSPDVAREIAELEAKRPKPSERPDEFARINEEISRLINEERAFKRASNGFRVL